MTQHFFIAKPFYSIWPTLFNDVIQFFGSGRVYFMVNQMVFTMVLLLDGNTEIGELATTNICYLLKEFDNSKCANQYHFKKKTFFPECVRSMF